MKNICIPLISAIVVALTVFSCSSGSGSREDSARIADSLRAENVRRDSLASVDSLRHNLRTPELALFMLKGDVASVTFGSPYEMPVITGCPLRSLTIDFVKGVWSSSGGWNVEISDGVPRSLSFTEGADRWTWNFSCDGLSVEEVEYSGPEGEGTLRISYDHDGLPKSFTDKSSGEGSVYIIRSEVTDVEKDSVGNWVSLSVRDESTEYDELGQAVDSQRRIRTIKRSIRYAF